MRDTGLNLGVREHCLDGFRKTAQPIHHGNQDVRHAAPLAVVEHLESELGAFSLLDP